jgi:hypothetical protein
MDHFTSLTPCERDETQARSLTRRRFLTNLATNAAVLGAVTATLHLSQPASAEPGPDHPAEPLVPVMTGAEYVAFLGGLEKPHHDIYTENDYRFPNDRWVQVAQGSLIEAIDDGTLTICPKCLFVNYEGMSCHICGTLPFVTYEDIEHYVEKEDGDEPISQEEAASEIRLYRMGRAVDLVDGPDTVWFSAAMLYAQDYLKAKAA